MNNNLPELITASDVKVYLKCSNSTLYALLSRKDFPSFRVGKKYLINKEAFLTWMEKEYRLNKIS